MVVARHRPRPSWDAAGIKEALAHGMTTAPPTETYLYFRNLQTRMR